MFRRLVFPPASWPGGQEADSRCGLLSSLHIVIMLISTNHAYVHFKGFWRPYVKQDSFGYWTSTIPSHSESNTKFQKLDLFSSFRDWVGTSLSFIKGRKERKLHKRPHLLMNTRRWTKSTDRVILNTAINILLNKNAFYMPLNLLICMYSLNRTQH